MAQKPTRDLWRIVFNNFWKSLSKINAPKGTLMGEDYFGNKYYEKAANPGAGKRKAERWFEPAEKDNFESERTAEWDAWLRGRRENAPTREELMQNLQIMNMKKNNAVKIYEKFGKHLEEKPQETIGTFPKYDEYEIVPGKEPTKK